MEEKIREIENSYNSNNHIRTIELCNSYLAKNDENIFVMNILGASLSLTGNNKGALTIYEKAIKSDPDNFDVKSNLAKIYRAEGYLNRAINHYKELYLMSEKNEYQISIGACYLDAGDFTNAQVYFEQSLKIDNANISALDLLSQALIKLKKYDDALGYINNGLKLIPKNPSFLNNKAVVYKLQKKYDKAISILNNLISSDINFPKYLIYNNLGSIYEVMGNLEKAKEHYLKSISINKNHELTNYNLGKIFKKENDIALSIDYFDKGGQLGKIKCLELYYANNNKEKYHELLNRYCHTDPHNNNVAAISAFASEQWEITNNYPLCHNPLSYLSSKNISPLLKSYEFSFTELLSELNILQEVWEPEDSTTKGGSQTFDNLFSLEKKNISILKKVISEEIKNYFESYNENDNSFFIKDWPKKSNLFGWVVNLKSEGFQSSHIHLGSWLSGVFYINIPDDIKGNEGAIKFSLQGFDYPMKKNSSKEKIIKPKRGDLVLFPSSLFHQTIPFISNDSRVCIAFDYQPKQ